jgi:DNA-binding PadR family transcriptional regulator
VPTRKPEDFLPLTPVAFEILLAVAPGPLHGYDILTGIEERTRGALTPNPGTLYRALDRLVAQGLLTAADERRSGGDIRRCFRLSALGAKVAAAEAARLADQLGAARARGVAPGRGRTG